MKAMIFEKVVNIFSLLQTHQNLCEPVESLLRISADEESGIVTADLAKKQIMDEVRTLGWASLGD